MSDVLPFIVLGITTGSIYGLAGLGLVLSYKTSGVFNFAHGALATAGAYCFYELHVQRGVPWPLALLVAVGVLAPLAGVGLELIARRLYRADPATQVAGTVGLLLAIQGGIVEIYGQRIRPFPDFLPTRAVTIAGVAVGVDQLIVVAVTAAAAMALFVFFRRSRSGLAMRAVVDDPELLGYAAGRPSRVRRQAWILGAGFAVVSGILTAPTFGLDTVLLTLLVVQAFGAAAFGRFSSLAGTYLGGLAVGVLAAVATKYLASTPALSGLPPNVPFFVLFAMLILRPPSGVSGRARPSRRSTPPVSTTAGAALVAGVLIVGAALPFVVGPRLPVFTSAAIVGIVLLSLQLLVHTSGQISLCHAGLVAIGASTFSHLTVGAGVPWLIALVLAGACAVPVGALIAVPAIRLSGLYLALATFGFGILLQRVLFTTGFMFGDVGVRPVARPGWGFEGDRPYHLLVVIVLALAIVSALVADRIRLGRLLRALADSPVALETLGASINVTRTIVFCLAAFLAGIAGALAGALNGTTSGNAYGVNESLLYLVAVTVAGRGLVAPPLIAASFLAVLPSYLGSDLVRLQPLLFGTAAVIVAVTRRTGEDEQSPIEAAARRAESLRSRSPVASRHDMRTTT